MIKAIEVEEAADAEALLSKEKKSKKWSNNEDEVEKEGGGRLQITFFFKKDMTIGELR